MLNGTCQAAVSMIKYALLQENCKCRRVGMADEADSKSVVGNHVRVQVPLPAVLRNAINMAGMPCLSHFLCLGVRWIFLVLKTR